MTLKTFITIFILVIFLFSITGCAISKQTFGADLKEEPAQINSAGDAAEGGEDVAEGLDGVTRDLEELEEIVK